jgi:acyl carrier protein
VRDRTAVVAEVRRAILETWPGRFTEAELNEARALTAEGLGLDSVEVVELILACERATGRSADETLFTASPLTIGRVVDYLCV